MGADPGDAVTRHSVPSVAGTDVTNLSAVHQSAQRPGIVLGASRVFVFGGNPRRELLRGKAELRGFPPYTKQ